MMRRLGVSVAISLLLGGASAKAVMLDDFSVPDVVSTDGSVSVGTYVQDVNVLGGDREIRVTAPAASTATVAGGSYTYVNGGGGGYGAITYDGADGEAGSPGTYGIQVDTSPANAGLNGVNVTPAGEDRFIMRNLNLTTEMTISIFAYDTQFHSSIHNYTLAAGSYGDYEFLFSDFAGINFATMDLVSIIFDPTGSNAGSASFDALETGPTAAPEPGTMGLMGLVGGIGYLMRRRKAAKATKTMKTTGTVA
jgi:hypothetical protein